MTIYGIFILNYEFPFYQWSNVSKHESKYEWTD